MITPTTQALIAAAKAAHAQHLALREENDGKMRRASERWDAAIASGTGDEVRAARRELNEASNEYAFVSRASDEVWKAREAAQNAALADLGLLYEVPGHR